ncbi:MAG: hypothetical protein Fur003_2130 [Candidatus Dojkabacteria bacterium]
MSNSKGLQDNYSELMGHNVFDVAGRIKKAEKIIKILRNFYKEDLKNSTILDYGSSTGIIATHLSNEVALVKGIDIDKKAVEYARDYAKSQKVKNVQFYSSKVELGNEKFDIIICNQIYEHVENQQELVNDLYSLLKDDGVIYFGATNKYIFLEPHYRLPLLSWFPKKISNFYIALFTKHKSYYEDLLSYKGLERLLKDFEITDVSVELIKAPEKYAANDIKSLKYISKIPRVILKLLMFFSPNWVFILKKKKSL